MERQARSCAGHHFLIRIGGRYVRAKKRSAFAERLASFGNQVREKLPGMGNDGPDFQFDRNAGGTSSFGEARGVIAQHFIRAHVDEKRREASEIGVERG